MTISLLLLNKRNSNMKVNGLPPVVMVALSLFSLLSTLILCCASSSVPSLLGRKLYNSGGALQPDDEHFDRSMSSRNLIASTSNTSTSTANIEIAALLAFKSSIHLDYGRSLANWTIENASNRCLTWKGVTCNSMGQVIGINLSAADTYLRGNITHMIGDFVHLSSLDLSSNRLRGPIPSELAKCHNLTLIDLSRNFDLDGEIPWELLSLPKLEKLWLSKNTFSGPVPGVIGNSCGQALTSLWIDRNRLSGSIPSSLGTCHNLKSLKMGFNRLNGSIPATLGELEQLEELWLDNNQISGDLPRELGSLKKLRVLLLNNINVAGSIPASLGNCSLLSEMDLSFNRLTGTIPKELGSLSSLQRFNLAKNRVMGSIPAELGNLTSLSILDLSSNALNGTIPDSLGRCFNLTELYLSSNGFTGQIPTQLGLLKKLEQLDLRLNNLVGNVPPSLGALRQLRSLQLRINNFTGSIPPSLGNCSSLWYLDMSHNSLTGTIPEEFGNMTSLRHLNLEYNKLTGSIPAALGNSTSLSIVLLSRNALIGIIPQSLGESKSLQTMDLSRNCFTGDVPAFSNPQLYSLDLSNNQLKGSALPLSSLYQCPDLGIFRLENNNIWGSLQLNFSGWFNLSYFSVSGNKLTGNIPSFESIRSRRLGLLEFSRNGFTGTIPPNLPSSVSIFNVSLNNLSGKIPTDFGFGTFTESSYLPGNPGLCGDVIRRPCLSQFSPSPQPNAPVDTSHEFEENLKSDLMSMRAFGVGVAMGSVAVLVTSIAWAPARHFVYGSPERPKSDQPYGLFIPRT